MVSVRGRLGMDPGQFRITRGAMLLLLLEGGLTLVWLLSPEIQHSLGDWLLATHANVWEHGRAWTLVTGALIETNFLGLILHAIMLWGFIPTLERFWGTPRFLRFAAITTVVGTTVGTAMGFVTGHGDTVAITGLNSFIYASIVAFGIVYARQPVQFWGVLPLTGRQLMFGFLGFLALSVVLRGDWDNGAGWAAAMIAAVVMTSKRWSPSLALKRWRIARARARLTVMQGGVPGSGVKQKPKRDEQRWLN
jgi:membrane associated rhomboid family serine protease